MHRALRVFYRSTAGCVGALLIVAGCGSGDGQGLGTPNPGGKHAGLPGYAYVTGTGIATAGGTVLEYAVAADGSLSPMIAGSVATGLNPVAITTDYGGHVYVDNAGDATISQFTIGANGALMPMTPATVPNPATKAAAGGVGAMAVDPTGRYLYVVNPIDGSVSQFSIGSSGHLTALNPASVPAGADPASISIDPSGRFVYVANTGYGATAGTGSISQYAIGNGGVLAALSPASIAPGGAPSATAIDSSGRDLYALSNCNNGGACTGDIVEYSIGSAGALTPSSGRVTTGSHFNGVGLLFDAAGTHAWALTNFMGVDTNQGTIWPFGVENGGSLIPANPVMFAVGPGIIGQSLIGTELYVLTSNAITLIPSGRGGAIYHYTAAVDGTLSLQGSTDISSVNPTAMLSVGAL
jgi:DNA-binding beta-propeller fold protein YncE